MKKQPKIITLHSFKGGAGKSVVSANLAADLALKGKKVALIDLDLRGPTLATVFSGLTDKSDGNLNEFLMGKRVKIFKKVKIGEKNGENIILYVSPSKMESHVDEILSNPKVSKKMLTRLISIKNYLNRNNFDFVIIDNSAGINMSSMNSIVLADYLILVTRPNYFEIEGLLFTLEQIYTKLGDENLKILLVINQIPTVVSAEELIKKIEDKIGEMKFQKVLSTIRIPCYCEMPIEATKSVIVLTQPKHSFSKNIDEIANFFIEMDKLDKLEEEN